MRSSAFTLLELLITIVIIGIVSTMVVPSFIGYQRASRLNFSKNVIQSVLAENSSKSRSYPKIFGVSALANSNEFQTFECTVKKENPEDCTKENIKTETLEGPVLFKNDFELRFLPPFGNISNIPNFTEDTKTITLQNGNESISLTVYRKSGLIE